MSDVIRIEKKDEVYLKAKAESHLLHELSDYFTFEVPGARFTPQFKAKLWDGRIRLFNMFSGELYLGLASYIKDFCRQRGYEFSSTIPRVGDDITPEAWAEFVYGLESTTNGEALEPRDYQLEAGFLGVRNARTLLLSPTACQDGDDVVLMADGTWKAIRDIVAGSYVMGVDGLPKEVYRHHTGEDEMFRVIPKSGAPFTVTGEHILSLRPTAASNTKPRYGVDTDDVWHVSVRDWMQWSKTRKHRAKLWYQSRALSFGGPSVPTQLPPYFVGLYLGDGGTTSINITTADTEIVREIEAVAKIFEMRVRVAQKTTPNKSSTLHLVCTKGKQNPIAKEFAALGLRFSSHPDRTRTDQKFIPDAYQQAPIDDRIELLSGLIDADGHLARHSYYEFVSKSSRLAHDVQRLAIGLGCKTTLRVKWVRGVSYYRVTLFGEAIRELRCRVGRKHPRNIVERKQKHMQSRFGLTGFTIEPLGRGEYHGIEVQDKLYVTNGGVVTHNSGKSFILYTMARWHQQQGRRQLIVVPTTSLVEQLASDFADYSSQSDWDADAHIHRIYSGKEKVTKAPIVISTWQSIYQLPKKFFEGFDVVYGDECHLFKAKSLSGLLQKMTNTPFKVGTTGTLDGTKTHRLVLEGLFGPVHRVTTTRELMDRKQLADLKIKCLVLKWPDAVRKSAIKLEYQDEMDFLVTNERRNQFLTNLALDQKGNTLLLFQFVEKHGKVLYEMIRERAAEKRKVFFVYGGVDATDREAIRAITEKESDAIIVASFGTFSTGVNIRNIRNIIFASPTKSRIRNLQSIGRGLRIADGKTTCTLYDIGDDMSWKSKQNTTLRHLLERIQMYNEEGFSYKLIQIPF